jgi:hypothetical protein
MMDLLSRVYSLNWVSCGSRKPRRPAGSTQKGPLCASPIGRVTIVFTAWKERRTFGADNSPTLRSHKYEQVCHKGIFVTGNGAWQSLAPCRAQGASAPGKKKRLPYSHLPPRWKGISETPRLPARGPGPDERFCRRIRPADDVFGTHNDRQQQDLYRRKFGAWSNRPPNAIVAISVGTGPIAVG